MAAMEKYKFKIPVWVSKETKKFVSNVIKTLQIKPEDEGLLMSLCSNYDAMIKARDIIAKEGICLIDDKGRTVRHPATAVLKQTSDLVIAICKEFTITKKTMKEIDSDIEETAAELFFKGK